MGVVIARVLVDGAGNDRFQSTRVDQASKVRLPSTILASDSDETMISLPLEGGMVLTAEAEQAVVVGEDERVKSAMEEGRHDLRKLRVGQTGIDCQLRYNHATAGESPNPGSLRRAHQRLAARASYGSAITARSALV